MTRFLHNAVPIMLVILAVGGLSGCGQPSSSDSDAPVIPDGVAIITFNTAGAGVPNVLFTHKGHSEQYLDNNCMECHNHMHVRDTTIWNCSECHTAGDAEGLCPNDAEGHACWMNACLTCHQTLPPPDGPVPACSYCHNL